MMETKFSRPADELSCIIGNLFEGFEPPCGYQCDDALVICGMTRNQNYGRLIVKRDHCIFIGDEEELNKVLNSRCLEGKCRHG